jgi:hypothetical protein
MTRAASYFDGSLQGFAGRTCSVFAEGPLGGPYARMTSRPFMYGRNTSGTVTLPSSFW